VQRLFKAKATLLEAAELVDGVGGDLSTEGLAL
jgi:hypothetical protein